MRKKLTSFLSAGLLVMVGTISYAAGPGTTAANFLKIGVGARAVAMGEAFTAVADDVTALYWNPAGLSQLEERKLSASYNSWFADVSQGYVSLGFPALGGTVAVGTNYVDMGTIERRDASGDLKGEFRASSIHASVGYARGDRFSIGFAGGMLRESIENDQKITFLGTAGILLKNGNLSLGACAQNVGGKLGEDPLPFILKAGAGLRMRGLNIAVDVGMPQDNDTYFCTGMEWWLADKFALRAGYRSGQDIGPGYTAGIGFKTNNLSLDYAYVPYDDLGTTHRVSLGIEF